MTDDDTETEAFDEWVTFLNAAREDRLRFEPGAFVRVEYDSSYTDETQVIEGHVEWAHDGLGRPFSLEGIDNTIRGWHVEGIDGRTIGRVERVVFERAPEAEA